MRSERVFGTTRWGVVIHHDTGLDHLADGKGGALCGFTARVWFETDVDFRTEICRRCSMRYHAKLRKNPSLAKVRKNPR